MLVLITTIAILVNDASIVIGLVGSICGSATIYVLPCILYDRAMAMYMDEEGEMKHPEERYLVRMIAACFSWWAGPLRPSLCECLCSSPVGIQHVLEFD
eukprot:CAMPEP_0177408340 /NCGR_PEP_ID=MMETSP0368-20130122/63619_1 /TAXON_ID=447022 ORGANISM="Scrippsiella hangoei-like, Strain SHHI-4" /NCGR_SAMPLE_ID=MMETSP0368 /ASSEMBLY_ACC=CAM_ASM_000363 /LENGTH=98 /DNA_ID=CAMNT_0018876957 /DNA_START=31 /DNA_END=327 /DNA_ORIENTATION=-